LLYGSSLAFSCEEEGGGGKTWRRQARQLCLRVRLLRLVLHYARFACCTRCLRAYRSFCAQNEKRWRFIGR